MRHVQQVCVFLSSSAGLPPHVRAIEELGAELARRDLTLVYGGAHRGLMGVLADATLAAGGRAIGVIPRALVDLEVAHTGLTELHIVDTMHQRKAMMFTLADAFVVAPGGLGPSRRRSRSSPACSSAITKSRSSSSKLMGSGSR